MLQTLRNLLRDRRSRREIHVRHPHGNPAESLFHLHIRRIGDLLRRNRIFAVSLDNICKIVLHICNSSFLKS